MRGIAREVLQQLLAVGNVKLVNKHWGPRGCVASFTAIQASGINPNLVLDIGAAKGTWTDEVLPTFPDAFYVLVDPLPENETSLLSIAKKVKRGRVISAAIGATPCTLKLFKHGDQSSFLPSNSFHGETLLVPVRTCDDIFDEVWVGERNTASILVKLDVQGFEMEALKGAERTLELTDILLVEVSTQRIYEGNPLAHEVIAFLGSYGFCIYDIASYVQRPHDRALTQMDLIFVRETCPLMSYVGWQ